MNNKLKVFMFLTFLTAFSNAAEPPAVEKMFLKSGDTRWVEDSGLFYRNKAIGKFEGMLTTPSSEVSIDLDRINKFNGDSDKYVFWLVTNSNYESLIAAFRKIYLEGKYKTERTDNLSLKELITQKRKNQGAVGRISGEKVRKIYFI